MFFEACLLFGNGRHFKIYRKLYCFIIFIQLFVLHAFLDPYSMVDLPNYIETFNEFASNSLAYSIFVGYVGVKMEIGWIILCKILSYISSNYQILLITISFIIVGCYCISIYRFSPLVWLSAFLFACTTFDQSLYVLRQHTAMALCLLTIPYIVKDNKSKFFLIYSIATLIHSTAIIFGIVYILNRCRFNKKFWYVFLVTTLLASALSSIIFNWVFLNTWYNSYGEKEGSNYTGCLIALCTLVLYLYSINWKTESSSSFEKCFFVMALLAVSVSFIGVGFSPTNRLVKYFTMSSIFLIPISINKIKNNTMRTAIILIVITLFMFLFFSPSNTEYIKNYNIIF